MRISIVTPVRKDRRVAHALCSIINQVHEHDLETVVINADFDQPTREALDKYKGHISKEVNERDEGIYDGMNKGIGMCTGDSIGILNADDRYANDHVLQRVAEKFEDHTVDACYGDMVMVDANDNLVRYWKSGRPSIWKWRSGWLPPHPTFFVRRELYERLGEYKPGLTLAADYELMLRFLVVHQVNVPYLDRVLVRMAIKGASNKSLGAKRVIMSEMNEAWRLNGMRFGRIPSVSRIFRVLGQLLLPKRIENIQSVGPASLAQSAMRSPLNSFAFLRVQRLGPHKSIASSSCLRSCPLPESTPQWSCASCA